MKKIEFVEESHTYLADGVIIPSVSELIRFKFPDAYKGIPEKILKNKASYGTKVHETIEDFVRGKFTIKELNEKKIDPNIKIAVEEFNELANKWCIFVKDMEQIVSWDGKYAGTYDIRTLDGDIIDLKTTSIIHENWLEYQLGLYYLGLGTEKPYGYCIHLPKGKSAEVKRINVKNFEECKELVNAYYEEKEKSN